MCRKKELIARSELTLPWRPFYRLVSDSIYSRHERHGLVLLPPCVALIFYILIFFVTVTVTVTVTIATAASSCLASLKS